ncbi:MAG TPA: DMT family transporter [Xanthobacteraceae bacterium]|jgi:drug/metabolite transporter (DMT)-like permease|nr:DMT family transporter [Xanthobacteraceae bacterium]
MDYTSPQLSKHATLWGMACGAGAALCWALGFVAARHGILAGVSPMVLALHRFVWPGFALLPMLAAGGLGNLGGIGWRRGITITVFGGLPLALWSYYGYIYVPLGHGAIIQPSCASLGGMILAHLVLKEALPTRRIVGAGIMVLGLLVIGAEALKTMGTQGLVGDLFFVAAGSFFAVFGMLLRLWHIPPMRAAAVTSVLSLAGLPMLPFVYDNFLAAGFYENLLQAIVQGLFAGAGAIYLFTRAVIFLGVGRAALYPALVPPFTLLIGAIALGEMPSALQLVGLAIVLIGFRLTQRA